VGTTKRERQKANRQQRLEQLAKSARKEKTRRRSLQIAVFVGGGLLLLFGLARLFGDDDDAATGVPPTVATSIDPAVTVDPYASTTSAAPTTTVDPDAPTTTAAPTTTVLEPFTYGAGACPEADGSSATPDSFEDAPELCIDPAKTYTADVVTNKGDFTITLDPVRSPGNVNNFVTLARYGYYDGTGCHRIIKDFVVQCGRPGTDESAPGYNVPDELPSDDAYEEGLVVMANSGQVDTGGGQWFIITGEQGASLPPAYSIIGKVTSGYATTVQALENLADPLTENGSPPLVDVVVESITITEADAG
jgi:cyclophilin family peptidyl-prolyl cis-trans isomerase